MSEKNVDILEEGALPRRVMTLFMLVDRSTSMQNEGNIGKVNRAIEETILQLKDVSDNNFDAEIKVAVLSFGTDVKWETGEDGVKSLDDMQWTDIVASGLTSMGDAFIELEKKLSRKKFLASTTGAYAPVIILLSDGYPTQSIDAGLEKLKHNNWYKCATKIAIAVKDSALDSLEKFTGSSETVIDYEKDDDQQKQDLQTLLTRLAVVSSTMQSRSRGASELGSIAEDSKTEIDVDVATETATNVIDQVTNENTNPWPGVW